MNYKDFTLGDWIGHISGAIEDERELDGNEMRDLVEFLTTLNKEPILDKIRAEIEKLPTEKCTETHRIYIDADFFKENVLAILDKYKVESEEKE